MGMSRDDLAVRDESARDTPAAGIAAPLSPSCDRLSAASAGALCVFDGVVLVVVDEFVVGEAVVFFADAEDSGRFDVMGGDEGQAVEAELADVFIYLVRLADVLGVDLLDAAERKLAANELRYPADQVRGSTEKRP